MTSAYPVDPSTPVGLFRTDIGDTTATDIQGSAPAQTATYEFFTDEAIEAFIARDEDLDMAEARALDSMARRLILEAQDIQVDDIRIKTVERAKLFSEHAAQIRLSAETGAASGNFQVVGLSNIGGYGTWPPQGTPFPGSL